MSNTNKVPFTSYRKSSVIFCVILLFFLTTACWVPFQQRSGKSYHYTSDNNFDDIEDYDDKDKSSPGSKDKFFEKIIHNIYFKQGRPHRVQKRLRFSQVVAQIRLMDSYERNLVTLPSYLFSIGKIDEMKKELEKHKQEEDFLVE